ncbi:MAG: hypothetical protein WA709_29290, partial [Stellaceae bacterium]
MISQLERLNSNETKIAPRSVWTAVNGSDLSAPTFMVSSKMDGSDPHFDAESIATHNTSWDLERDQIGFGRRSLRTKSLLSAIGAMDQIQRGNDAEIERCLGD